MAVEETQRFHVDESKYQPPDYKPFRIREFPRDDADWKRVQAMKTGLDVLTVDVIEWGIEAAIEEAEAAVERTARSTIIREQHDYRASLNTVDCNSVSHVSWAATADPIRAYYELEDIHEDDVFLYNDVYESSGTIGHLPDYCIVVPVFGDGRVIAFSQVFGHCNDVGGRVVGSWPITSTNIFEEGLPLPANQDVQPRRSERGRVQDRPPKQPLPRGAPRRHRLIRWCRRIVDRRMCDLAGRYGVDVVESAFYRIIDRCAEIAREVALPHIPDGEYVGEDFVENDGISHNVPVKIQITIRKDADKIIADFAGTDPQTEGPINWPMDCRHYAKWLSGLLKAQVPGLIVNEGAMDVFRAYLPPRTVLSPEYPAPVVDRMMCMLRMISAYIIAMSKAFDGKMMADMQGIGIYGLFGHDDEGEFFLYREIFGSGTGARWYADGEDAIDYVPNSRNLPAEFIEQRYPVTVDRVGLWADSGGPGQYRGGKGYMKDLRILEVDGNPAHGRRAHSVCAVRSEWREWPACRARSRSIRKPPVRSTSSSATRRSRSRPATASGFSPAAAAAGATR